MKFLRADLLFYVTDMSGLENCTAAREGKDFLVAPGIAGAVSRTSTAPRT
jgi:hypothetical protein